MPACGRPRYPPPANPGGFASRPLHGQPEWVEPLAHLVEESTRQLGVDVSLECAWLQPRKRGQGGGRVLAESVSYALDAYLEGLRKVWVRAGAPPQGVKLQVDIAGSVYSESGEEFVYAAHDAVAARFQFPGVVGFKLNSLRASAEW